MTTKPVLTVSGTFTGSHSRCPLGHQVYPANVRGEGEFLERNFLDTIRASILHGIFN